MCGLKYVYLLSGMEYANAKKRSMLMHSFIYLVSFCAVLKIVAASKFAILHAIMHFLIS